MGGSGWLAAYVTLAMDMDMDWHDLVAWGERSDKEAGAGGCARANATCTILTLDSLHIFSLPKIAFLEHIWIWIAVGIWVYTPNLKVLCNPYCLKRSWSTLACFKRLAPISFLLAPVILVSRTQVFQNEQSGIGINWINGALGCLLSDFYRELRSRTKKPPVRSSPWILFTKIAFLEHI